MNSRSITPRDWKAPLKPFLLTLPQREILLETKSNVDMLLFTKLHCVQMINDCVVENVFVQRQMLCKAFKSLYRTCWNVASDVWLHEYMRCCHLWQARHELKFYLKQSNMFGCKWQSAKCPVNNRSGNLAAQCTPRQGSYHYDVPRIWTSLIYPCLHSAQTGCTEKCW